ncbi:MAG: HAD hydrolase-like protein [Lentisphaerae bacterium]|nr:HAD hydrolase-like protein [Lentisphaerota bacterium]MCP4100952.1 HAD hydrolase-like protein [Lentisphaerota bacterium]
MKNKIKVVGVDADDTLWVNQPYFDDAENTYASIMAPYISEDKLLRELLNTQSRNIPIYGYGVKSFVLSMIETACLLSHNKIDAASIQSIIKIGKDIFSKQVELLDHVDDVLKNLKERYRLILMTKGDLLDQKRKLHQSRLKNHFHHVEVMSNKAEEDYAAVFKRNAIVAEEFMMIGNSMKSDIIPVLNLGAYAMHVPYHATWVHEVSQEDLEHPKLLRAESIKAIMNIL